MSMLLSSRPYWRLELRYFSSMRLDIQLHARFGYGRAKIGDRANVSVKAVRGKNYSVYAPMNKDSLYYYMAKKVSFNTDHFIDFLDGLFSCFEKDGLTDI